MNKYVVAGLLCLLELVLLFVAGMICMFVVLFAITALIVYVLTPLGLYLADPETWMAILLIASDVLFYGAVALAFCAAVFVLGWECIKTKVERKTWTGKWKLFSMFSKE